MHNYQKDYYDKLVSADVAVKIIKSGQRVFIGAGATEPQSLIAALVKRSSELSDVQIVHSFTLGIAPYTEQQFANAFRLNTLFIGHNVRSAVIEKRADYTPIFLSDIPRLFRSGTMPIDVALISVSPPDKHGFCSYGVSVEIIKSATESAKVVIAQINNQMPRTLGDSFLPISRIDYLVESNIDLLELAQIQPDEVAMKIGQYVADLIEDGSTIQMGIGNIPNAVLKCLADKKDIGVHTEMFSDGVIDLIEAGVINCANKTFLPGKVVSSFCIGTRKLYEYVDDNSFFEFRPVEFTNDPFVIARNAKMIAINAALEIDFTGQVCADSIGYQFFSGIGGQVDFIRGAARSDGGKPIIVIPSTAKKGSISRIVSCLKKGAGVVTTRGDVHYVVTEYGVANLWGKSIRERVFALINIAHPKFRDELLQSAVEQKYV